MKTILLITMLILGAGVYAQKSCSVRSLSPDLTAKICIPSGAKVYNIASRTKEMICGDYMSIYLKIVLPKGSVIYVKELPRCDMEDGVAEQAFSDKLSAISSNRIHKKGDNYVIEKLDNGNFRIHSYHHHYGWPYYLKTTPIPGHSVDIVNSYIQSLDFNVN